MHSLRIVVITEPSEKEGEKELITQLFKSGLKTLHIRKPRLSLDKMRRFIESIPAQYHDRLVLHSWHKLSLRYKIKGIHFPESARVNKIIHWLSHQLYSRFRPGLTFSASYHSLDEVGELGDKYNYIFLSPVFESISKKTKEKPLKHGRIQDALRLTKAKVVALGGIDASNISACRDMGFYGVALLGAIWQSPDPIISFKEIKKLCKADLHAW